MLLGMSPSVCQGVLILFHGLTEAPFPLRNLPGQNCSAFCQVQNLGAVLLCGGVMARLLPLTRCEILKGMRMTSSPYSPVLRTQNV